jgi:hypothetical protein
MFFTVMRISGNEARAVIENQLAAHGQGLTSALAQYRRDDAIAAWHETIRALEEFINLPLLGISDPQVTAWLSAVRLDGPFLGNPGLTLKSVREALTPHLEPAVVARFTTMMLHLAAVGIAFTQHGQYNSMLDTIAAQSNIVSHAGDTSSRFFTPWRARVPALCFLSPTTP